MRKSSKILLTSMISVSLNAFSATEMDMLKAPLTLLEKQLNTPSSLNISGVIEVEYGFEDFANGKSNEITLATAELSIEGALNEQFDAYLILLYEQDKNNNNNNNNIKVDEAILNGKTIDGKYAFAVGRLYVPFGVYKTAAISGTVGSDIGETVDEAIVLSANFSDDFSASIWLADNANAANNSGVSLSYEDDMFAFGLDWIDSVVENNESGLAVYGSYVWDNFALIVEHITETSGANEAKSTQIEVNYTTENWVFAVVHNNINNFGDYDSNIILTGEYTLTEGAILAAEYKTQDRIDNTGDDDVVTLLLAYEF